MAQNNRFQFRIILLGSMLGAFLLLGCEKHNTIELQDPFLDSFKGREIKRIVSFDSKTVGFSDTSILDRRGNIIEKKQYGLTLKMAYDSGYFPIRMLFLNDASENFLIDYHLDEDRKVIIQRWRTIHTLDWNFNETDIDSTLFNVVVFDLKDDLIIAKKDTLANQTTHYLYDDEEKLIRQDIVDENGSLSMSIIYEYTTGGKLISIYARLREVDLYRHYFTDGLLDSTQYLHPSDMYTRKYKYEFD